MTKEKQIDSMIKGIDMKIEDIAQGLSFSIQASEELEELEEMLAGINGVADLTTANICREALRKVKRSLAYDLYNVINDAIVELELTEQEGGAE